MKYTVTNGIRIAEVPVSDFKIVLYDDKKKSMGPNRCNAGFFANYSEGKEKFTLPVGHLVCDYAASSKWTDFYCKQRGTFDGKKFRFDSGNWTYMNNFYGKSQSTLVISKGKASIQVLPHAPEDCSYAISGIPIMRNGNDVIFNTYVKQQGWDGSTLYGTWHIFVGIKERNASTIYIMGMKTTSGNMILTREAYKKFKALGFYDVIKLDGGGSFYLNANGKVTSTLENRRVCTILDFGSTSKKFNPYPSSTRTLTRGKSGDDVRWLQWELSNRGFPCTIDGSFGPGTEKQLKLYQSSVGLGADGSCGPATIASLCR